MSSPIKPPGKPPGTPPPDVGGADATSRTKGPSEAFRDALAGAEGPEQANAVTAKQGAQGADALKSISEDLRAGRIDAAGAVDRLVARALDAVDVRALPPTKRAELEAFLRNALRDDPTLGGLVSGLEPNG